jgi:hypothetical protein
MFGLTVNCDESTIDLFQALEAVLQRLGHIVTPSKWRFFWHENVYLDTYAVASVVALHALETFHKWCKAVCHEHDFTLHGIACSFAG